jgi:hypothetical protein
MRPRLTYANVISTICLCLLLGGGISYAAFKLPKNSVGTKQLKKNAVTGQKVKDGSLTGQDIDAGSLASVPSAKKALTADQANTANTAQTAGSADYAARATSAGNGAVPIDWSSPGVQFRPSETILFLDELTLSAWCEDTNGLHEADYVQVFFTTTKPGSVGWAFSSKEESSPVAEQGYLTFEAGSDNRIVNQRSYFGTGLQDGQAIFRFDDRVITVLLHARADNSANDCQVNGIAFSAPG